MSKPSSNKKQPATLRPFIFDIEQPSERPRKLSYWLPVKVFRLLPARGSGAVRYPSLDGLDVVLGWLVPEVDLFSIARPKNGRDLTVRIDIFEPPSQASALASLKLQVESAVRIWVSAVIEAETNSDEADRAQEALGDKRSTQSLWEESKIKLNTNLMTVCRPASEDAYHYYIRRACSAIARPCSPDAHHGWIVQGARKSYGDNIAAGRQLLGREMHATEDGRAWAPFLRVFPVRTPGVSNLRLGIQAGTRSFTNVKRPSSYRDDHRTLDLLITPSGTSGHVDPVWVPASVKYQRARENDQLRLQRSRRYKILDAVAKFVGQDQFFESFNGHITRDTVISAYPRASAKFGDRRLAGGTGIGIPERERLSDQLRVALENDNYRMLEPLGAISARGGRSNDWQRPFSKLSRSPASENDPDTSRIIRESVRRAILQQSTKPTLRVCLFWDRLGSSDVLGHVLDRLFGQTPLQDEQDGSLVRREYDDGLVIELQLIPSSVLSQPLSAPSIEVPEGLSQQDSVRFEKNAKTEHRNAQHEAFEAYLAEHLPQGDQRPLLVALLEMDEGLQEKASQDPFATAQFAFASAGCPVQVVLYDPSARLALSGKTPDDRAEKQLARARGELFSILCSSMLDLLLCLGVSPRGLPPNSAISSEQKKDTDKSAEQERRHPETTVMAWWIIRKTRPTFVTPICVVENEEGLHVAILRQSGEAEWLRFADAQRAIALQQIKDLASTAGSGRKREEEQAAVAAFYAACLRRFTPDTLYVEAANIRQAVPGLGEAGMQFGTLALGAPGRSPELVLNDDGLTNIVRVQTDDEVVPSYVVANNATGIAGGAFPEPASERVCWISNHLITAQQTSRAIQRANQAARLPEHGDDDSASTIVEADRKFPRLIEMTALVLRNGAQTQGVAQTLRNALQSHVTSVDRLRLPFPLHEARKLAGHLR